MLPNCAKIPHHPPARQDLVAFATAVVDQVNSEVEKMKDEEGDDLWSYLSQVESYLLDEAMAWVIAHNKNFADPACSAESAESADMDPDDVYRIVESSDICTDVYVALNNECGGHPENLRAVFRNLMLPSFLANVLWPPYCRADESDISAYEEHAAGAIRHVLGGVSLDEALRLLDSELREERKLTTARWQRVARGTATPAEFAYARIPSFLKDPEEEDAPY